MRATFCALEPEGRRFRLLSVRGHGPLLQSLGFCFQGFEAVLIQAFACFE